MRHPRRAPGRVVRWDGFENDLSLLAAQERLRRRRFAVPSHTSTHAIGFTNGLAPGRAAARPPGLAGRRGSAWRVGPALVAAALLLISLSYLFLPSEGPAARDDPVARDLGPTATSPPVWPSQWNLLVTDPDTGVVATVVDIVEVRWAGSWWDSYTYIRVATRSRAFWESGGLNLASHSWWLYLDFGDGNNDWIVEERSLGICSHAWNGTGGDWGIGPGCDVFDTLTDTDVGSAVRILKCSSNLDCVDFALEKSAYPGLGSDLIVTAAADKVEDLDLAGDTFRNPRNAYPACDPVSFDDCTPPARISLQIPEFPSLLAVVVGVPTVLIVMRRRRARTTAKTPEAPMPPRDDLDYG